MLNTQALGSANIKWLVDPKTCVWSAKGKCIAEFDFKSQELFVAAIESMDSIMLESFRAPEYIPDAQGNLVDNPDADMHCLTAKSIYPDIFKDANGQVRPKYDWVKISKTKGLIKLPKTPRDIGKITNFGLAYMQTAKSLSDMHFIPVAETERWVLGHQETYPEFHAWAREQMHLAETRGWARTSWWGRCRFVQESNSKGSKESPGIMGLNFRVCNSAPLLSN